MPAIRTFALNSAEIAPCIYRDYPHETTPVGAILTESDRHELKEFLEAYLHFLGSNEHQFLRLDVFLGDDALNVIEINAELQDGWGVALNLLRASGNTLPACNDARFPTEIIAYSEDYMPEFKLAQNELARIGKHMHIAWWRDRPGVLSKSTFDDKMYLARFSREWRGNLVRIPKTYWAEHTAWEHIPDDVVFKFRHKYGEHARRAGYSVRRRADIGKGKFMRQCYAAGHAVAQERIEPFRLEDGSATQAIIMCSGHDPIAGYLQVAPPDAFVINDRATRKGPLVFE